MGKLTGIIVYGTTAGIEAAVSAASLIDYATLKYIAMQEYVSKAPELTDEVIDAAHKAAQDIGSGSFYRGMGFAAVSAFFGALALYEASTIKKQEK